MLWGLSTVVTDSFDICDVVEVVVDDALESVGETFFMPILALGDPELGSSDNVGLLNDPIDARGRTVLGVLDSAGRIGSNGCSPKSPLTDARGRTVLPTVLLPDLTTGVEPGDLYGVLGFCAPGAFDDAARRSEDTLFGVFSVCIDGRLMGVCKVGFAEARKSIGTA